MESIHEPVSSREDCESVVSSSLLGSTPPVSPKTAASQEAVQPANKRASVAEVDLQNPKEDAAAAEPLPASPRRALSLVEQLRRRQRARDSNEWDIEDAEVDAVQLDNVIVGVNRLPSDATDELSPAATEELCPIKEATGSLPSELTITVPYQAQYRRVIEGEEDAEIERLLRQLEEEQQAVRDLAAAQRYQMMQEQLALIQKQLGDGSTKVPDLDWLLANEPENTQELDEVVAAFAARDDDLPHEEAETPELPLTCRNIFCRCPWRGDVRKDERAIRWALICCPLGIPLFLGVIMSLCSIKRRQPVVKALAWLSCALFTIISAALIIGLAVALSQGLQVIEEGKQQEAELSEAGSGTSPNPYNLFTTTTCGSLGIRVKIEHASRTHVLNEEVFGTVAFIGLSRANTWDIMGLLDLAFDHDFDAIAITPPGHGNTTQVEEEGGGFWNPGNLLKHALESCLGISLAKTVVVSHSNFVTRKYFIPLLMSDVTLGFVLFDSSVGTEWMNEYDPDVNDHKFYQVRTKHYRYVGNRRLEALDSIKQALNTQHESYEADDGFSSSPTPDGNVASLDEPLRIFSGTSLQGYCRADPKGPEDSFPKNSTLGPFDFFPGKYKMPGWDTARRRFRETPLDPPADDGMATRLVSTKYFEPLRDALGDFLEELKQLSLKGMLQIEEPRPLRFNNRQAEYDKSRENTTKIDPETIYCVETSTAVLSTTRSAVSMKAPAVHLVNPEKYRQQKEARALRSTTTSTVLPVSGAKVKGHVHSVGFSFSLGAMLSHWMP